MEEALKGVFHAHRTVVRGLRVQLHQAKQERDKFRNRLNETQDQLENDISRLKEEMDILHSIVQKQKYQAVCGCRRFDGVKSVHPSSPVSPLTTSQETRTLEQQVNIMAQELSTISQHLEETRQDKTGLLQSTENQEFDEEASQTEDTVRKSNQPSSQMGRRKDEQPSSQMGGRKDEQSRKYSTDLQTAGQNYNTEFQVTRQNRNTDSQLPRQSNNTDSQGQRRKHKDSQAARKKDNTDLQSSGQNEYIQSGKAERVLSKNRATENILVSKGSDDITKKSQVLSSHTKNSQQLLSQSCNGHRLGQERTDGPTENCCLLAKASNFQELSDNVALTLSRHKKCANGVENRTSSSWKSPDEGTKLQLMRNVVKRRRYTEDESIKKQKRLCSKNGGTDHKQDRSNGDAGLNLPVSGVESHSNQFDMKHNLFTKNVNRGSNKSVKSVGFENTAANQNNPTYRQDVSHSTDHTCSQYVQDKHKEVKTGRTNEAACLVPDTLEMDLFSNEEEVETGQKPGSSGFVSESGNDKKPEHSQGKRQTVVGLSAHSCSDCSSKKKELNTHPTKHMKSWQADRESREACKDIIDEKETNQQISSEERTSQGIWPTDSVVFGSTRPRMVSHSVHEAGGSSSVYIDEGHVNTEHHSPVFLTHHNEPPYGDQSPTLFDKGDSDIGDDEDCISTPRKTDNEECISSTPEAVLKRPPIHWKVEQPSVQDAETTLVSPVSPMLLKPSWSVPKHVPNCNSSSQSFLKRQAPVSIVPGQQAGSREASQFQTLQVTDDLTVLNATVPCSPAVPKDLPDPGASQVWSWAPPRKLFKSKTAPAPPSADDTINPALLDPDAGDTGDHETVRGGHKSARKNQPALCSQLNASLDPAVRLTQYLKEPSLGKEDQHLESQENKEGGDISDLTLDPEFLRVHQTSGQDVTLISQSSSDFHTASQQATASVPTQMDKQTTAVMTLLEDSFDRVPQKKTQQPYVFNEVVRKQNERKKLKAFTCQECEQYYGAIGLSDAEVKKRMGQCSRHRARQAPPSTPEHFWSVGFPDTPE